MKEDVQALSFCDQNGDAIDECNKFKRKIKLGKGHGDSEIISV